jgi:hypothetical protein
VTAKAPHTAVLLGETFRSSSSPQLGAEAIAHRSLEH